MNEKSKFRAFLCHPRSICLFLFCTAFLARVVFYLIFRKDFNNLGINHWLDIARNLVSGAGYSEHSLLTYFPSTQLEPTAARGPVPVLALSLLLLIFRSHYELPLLIYSWSLSSITAVLLYFLSRNVFRSAKAGLVTALTYCFYLPEMFISTAYAAASESLFTLLLMAYFWAMIRSVDSLKARWAAVSGLLLGLACLSRPVVLLFPIFYVAWMFQNHRVKAMMPVVIFLAALILCLSPWVIRNQIVFHRPVVSTTLGGYNLLRHNGMLDRNDLRIYTAEDFAPLAREVVAKAGYRFDRLNEVQLDQVFKLAAIQQIRAFPWRYLKLCVLRSIWLWYKINAERFLLLFQNCLIYLFMFPGLVLVFIRRHSLRVFAVHILYFVLIHAAINAQFRFICPMMPYGIMLAVYTALLLKECLCRKVN
jgi:hypothetical protein